MDTRHAPRLLTRITTRLCPGRRVRRAAVVAGSLGALLLGATLAATPASAATLDGSPVETSTQFCSASSLSARTNLTVISPGAQPQVGQDFFLLMTVVGLNQCLPTQGASINVLLPSGVSVSAAGLSRCVTFASSNPGGTTQTVPCVRSNGEDGFLRIDPQGASSWSLSRTGRNVAQVQLAVRATSAGQLQAFGRMCDFGSSVDCLGSPVANAIPTLTFSIAAAPAAPPPATIGADQLPIRKVGTICPGSSCPDLATTTTSIKVQAYITGSHPAGAWVIQRRGPGATSFSTIATKNLTQGGGFASFTTTATGLQPGTTHRFRACLTPTGGTRVCGADIQLTTKSA